MPVTPSAAGTEIPMLQKFKHHHLFFLPSPTPVSFEKYLQGDERPPSDM